ncbi:MAG: response regulator [Elusimicrobia bacterium]|nr:response regulator [Elusimicrobiota bacterium]
MGGNKIILIVDDDADVRFVIRIGLEKDGFIAEEAQDGLEALKRLKQFLPDAILLDIMMPGLDGFGVRRRVKGDPKTAGIPIVVITGKAHIKEVFELRASSDIAAYLEKPFPLQMLTETLNKIFSAGSPAYFAGST